MSDKKKVEEIHNLFIGLEQESSDGKFDQMFLQELITLIGDLEKSEDPILQKLSKYKKLGKNCQGVMRRLNSGEKMTFF